MEIFWDETKIFSDSLSTMKTYPECTLLTAFGNHKLKLMAKDTVIEEKKIFIFPMRYLAIDYYGKDFYEGELSDFAFVVTESLTPIAIE
jgi:hypothetical protein